MSMSPIAKNAWPLANSFPSSSHFFCRVRILAPSSRAALAAIDRVLQALFGARVVPVIAVAVRHRHIGLLNVREHLVIKLVAQAGKRRHHRFSVGVFSLEVIGNFGILFVPQPGIVVGEHRALDAGFGGSLVGNRRSGKRILSHYSPSVVEPPLRPSRGTVEHPSAYN